ncbi:hypothetical protein ABH935_007112 [Catenulispora sp. GAS73]|uniref:pPIWI_RE_Z domain-containing protein n=1 Tax=Catenulispora sp. GAS73 TaxID=3156269 RepID=UPI003518231F
MRAWSEWNKDLLIELADCGFPGDGISPAGFCAVELGLFFLAEYFPDEPIGALPELLNKYIVAEQDLTAELRRLRHRMGDAGRRGYWRGMLNEYVRVPEQWRWFTRTDDGRRPVDLKTRFASKRTPYCVEREVIYRAALEDPIPYDTTPTRKPAEAGKRYYFLTHTGEEVVVQMPGSLPEALAVVRLPEVTARSRAPWAISIKKDLAQTAAWIDMRLEAFPEIDNRDWVGRLENRIWFSAVDPYRRSLIDRPADFTLDGIAHIVGLMNSGKTTLTDLITIDRVRSHGDRVCLVVSSVGDVFAKVSFLRTLGIDAVPLIGRNSKEEHATRYWRTRIEEEDELIPDSGGLVDPSAAYANASCLLEPFRVNASSQWQALRPADFPCSGGLRLVGTPKPRKCDCPLLSICPAQKAMREVTSAQVWVTTPQALIASRAEPADESMRWFEAVQKYIDLLIVDEADSVQQVFDQRFIQTVSLVDPDHGWTHRMEVETSRAMGRLSMNPSPDSDVIRWHERLRIHGNAVFWLNSLALSPDGEALKELLGSAPFTSHALLRRACRMLFGLPRTGDGDKETEDLAEDFYREHLQRFAEQPFDAGGPNKNLLHRVAAALDTPVRDLRAVVKAIDQFIDTHVWRERVSDDRLEQDRPLLRQIIEAAVWTGRITTTFFEMTAMYPSVRGRLHLPDEETFWVDRPPRDYQALVPEAPMGNVLALRWAANRGGGAGLQLLWVHGIGRWLLHHAHDLLECEGIAGPHVILTSATSWAPGSSFYHIPIMPTAVLRQPDEDREALMRSRMEVRPQLARSRPIFVSGHTGEARNDALRQLVSTVCTPVPGAVGSIVDELLRELPEDRRKLLFVVLSGPEARTVGDHINNKIPNLSARIVVPDAAEPGAGGIARRLVGRFGRSDADILVAAELSIQRGYNILNTGNTAALGGVVYLTRNHPPPYDLAFPLSLVSQFAIERLQNPPVAGPGEVAELGSKMRKRAHGLWFGVVGRPVHFRSLKPTMRTAFVANNLVPMSQTIGRTIRGNQPTIVVLCDAAFAERFATADPAPDTSRTSIVVATDRILQRMLAVPAEETDDDAWRLHAVNEAVWGLMGHLFSNNDPLGSARGASA